MMVQEVEFITRPEYEARQAEIRTDLARLASEAAADRKDIQTELKILSNKIDGAKVSAWKLVAISTINFMLGGGCIAFLNYLHFPR